jgi:LacI family transcriptional regulator
LNPKKSILLLTGDVIDLRVSQLAKGILDECHRLNWGMRWREGRHIKSRDDFGYASAVITRMDKKSLSRLQKYIPPNVPLVSADGCTLDTDIPTVSPDPVAIGRMTAEHLIEQGLRSFLIVGSTVHISTKRRTEAFADVIRQKLEHGTLKIFNVPQDEFFWDTGSVLGRRFVRLLKNTPMPVGVMASSDEAAVSCLECLQDAGIRCPMDMAIVGSSNDPVYTKIITPLSSVAIDFEKAGAIAVNMVQQMLSAKASGKHITNRYLPAELIVRKSSQIRLMADERIAKAVDILQARYTEDLRLPELAAECGMSRASFCSKFTEAVGESPIRYLINYRLGKALHLLAETNLSVGQIIEKAGFNEQPYFTRAFRQRYKMTPTQYRQKMVQGEE